MRYALLSVSEKAGIVDLGRGLARLGFCLLSTGGTARVLREGGVAVRDVAEHTGFPEMLDGRVKTLHPRVHGGILARATADHRAALAAHDIPEIDLVAVNLYPFARTAAVPGVTLAGAVEEIDIGGPALIRAAAKNHERVTVVVDPADYTAALEVLERAASDGDDARAFRRRLAEKAFAHTAAYDAGIATFLGSLPAEGALDPAAPAARARFSRVLGGVLPLAAVLRYGENPHQEAALYLDGGAAPAGCVSVARARQLQGKELSYNNYLDLDAALRTARAFAGGPGRPVVVAAVKHTNPCGVGRAPGGAAAFARARAADPVSIFGGVVAVNAAVDAALASACAEVFLEAVIAPGFSAEARAALAGKKALRLLETGDDGSLPVDPALELRSVSGGVLLQEPDLTPDDVRAGQLVTRRAPTEAEWDALDVAWRVCRHVKSNAIVYADREGSVGVGAGQMSRVESARLGARLARLPLAGTAVGSDAFFPFRDGLDACAEAGATAVAQPGGSKRDDEIVAAADEHGVAMVFTGRRHFRH
ncbi:MAG TPA: bifunctional phosphoribosylaminoimidazolecarboxamide formyltransferase/IMP cyclohydrolase [Myxococcota bacterium]|jgi:phosphoribosylaminoimidazolecarboxamide formyltransferase/IMP cyclohydrolase|nr:bifunctional phosphoribosylaminoimidazolecarboxamide formyltransferase/IMP cyclohydrolase [Myxococcota bacterium]